MLTRLLKADLARSAVVALTLTALIALASTLMSASTSLIVDTASAMSRLSQRAKVPDLIQMHTGDLDPATIEDWTDTRSDITEHEIIKTLPIPRQELWIDGVSQTGSYHEPAFVTAPQSIDLLLDEDGDPVHPSPGQVALPVHYKAVGAADVGDTITVDTGDWTMDLEVVGFVRDAQMNAAMIPSKRLVISPEDFSSFEEHLTETEYLIEFSLADGAITAKPANPQARNAQGNPARPVFHEGCAYAAWTGTGRSLRDCPGSKDDESLASEKLAESKSAEFRTNRRVIVLNDAATGNVWLPDKDMVLVNDWNEVNNSNQVESDEHDDSTDLTTQRKDPDRQQENHPPTVMIPGTTP